MQALGFCQLKIATVLNVTASFAPRAASGPSTTTTSTEHMRFIRDVAGLTEPQPYLPSLLSILHGKGETPCSSYDAGIRKNLFPLAIPLTKNPDDNNSFTALLRWPTPVAGMNVPVVSVHSYGVKLLAQSMAEYIHRALAEEDSRSHGQDDRLFSAAGETGRELYRRGESLAGGSLDVYLMKRVGKFPDVFERLALNHLTRGDEISALVTGEFYAGRQHFPGFGRPFVFNAELMQKVGRKAEAKDAARIGLKSPWWTLGCSYDRVAELAGWGDEQVEFMRERVTEEGRQEDLLKGKTPGQVALDQAAFLLDLAAVDGSWGDIREQLASYYDEAGLGDVSRFLLEDFS